MVNISKDISESLKEYLVLTGWVKAKPEDVSLETKLGDITLQYPYMTARMQSVVGPEMAVAAGRNGILTCVPRSLRDEDKQAILDANDKARLKKGDIEFVHNPDYAKPNDLFGDVIYLAEKTGHSIIPILDRFSKLYGFYIHDPDNMPSVPPTFPIKDIMRPLQSKEDPEGIPYLHISKIDNVKPFLAEERLRFVALIDDNGALQKLAFPQKFDTNYIGMAISSRNTWEQELERWGSQVDTLMLDSSNICFDDALDIVKAAKKRFPNKPFGVGNIIRGRDFDVFADAGADYIIGGMAVGSICQTGSERGNGRGQFTVANELADARNAYKDCVTQAGAAYDAD